MLTTDSEYRYIDKRKYILEITLFDVKFQKDQII